MTAPILNIPKQTILPLRAEIIKKLKGEVADTENLSQNTDDPSHLILTQNNPETAPSGISEKAGEAGAEAVVKTEASAGAAAGVGEAPLWDFSTVLGAVGGVSITTGGALATGSGIVALAVLGGGRSSSSAPTGSVSTNIPVITSAATASFAENGTGTVYTVTATDADVGAVLTYALGGIDAALFNIDSNTGVVTFKPPPRLRGSH